MLSEQKLPQTNAPPDICPLPTTDKQAHTHIYIYIYIYTHTLLCRCLACGFACLFVVYFEARCEREDWEAIAIRKECIFVCIHLVTSKMGIGHMGTGSYFTQVNINDYTEVYLNKQH